MKIAPTGPPRLRAALDRLLRHFERVEVRPSRGLNEVGKAEFVCGKLPDDLRQFYEFCDGIVVGLRDEVLGTIHSLKEALACWPCARCLLPIRSDGCGDYDCVMLGEGVASGAVVFWDSEQYESPAYLLGGTFASYFEMWADHLVTRYRSDGEEDPRYVASIDWPVIGESECSHLWPFDEE